MSTFYENISDITKVKQKNGRGDYYLALNGNNDYVRPPHIHIYKKKENWTIEINFQKFLCTGDPYIRRVKDPKRDIYPNDDEQFRYENYKEFLLVHLYNKPNVKKPDYVVNAKDNIAAAIAIFNEEADIVRNGKKEYANVPKREKFLTIMKENCDLMKILSQFREYFPEDLQKKYSMCFQ